MSTTTRNEAVELWDEYDNVAYFVGAAYASPQEEARLSELKALILAAERRATVERICQRVGVLPEYEGEIAPILEAMTRILRALDEEAAR